MEEKNRSWCTSSNANDQRAITIECASDTVEPYTMYADCPFLVKVSIPDLNIRKGAGTNTAKTGAYTGVGVFTITQVKSGSGLTLGWGKLKSGAGWISLDYCKRVS